MGPGLPPAGAGRAIGLFGGSFDPAHEGHAHVTREALKRFGLDEIWWLVSPGNPLKERGPAPLARRLERARMVMRHPRVRVTALETQLGTRFTADTIRAVRRRYPGRRFVWVMGADGLAEIHRWRDWRAIFGMVPVGVVARPGERLSARLSVAARRFRRFRLAPGEARRLADAPPPAWVFVNLPMSARSSTAIREAGDWPEG